MKRVVYLAAAAMVALLILAPMAAAQGTKMMEETMKMEKTEKLPTSGGPAISSVLLPATALLVGSGVIAYAVMRRRR